MHFIARANAEGAAGSLVEIVKRRSRPQPAAEPEPGRITISGLSSGATNHMIDATAYLPDGPARRAIRCPSTSLGLRLRSRFAQRQCAIQLPVHIGHKLPKRVRTLRQTVPIDRRRAVTVVKKVERSGANRQSRGGTGPDVLGTDLSDLPATSSSRCSLPVPPAPITKK